MPEGDTIHRTAARLRPALVGRSVVRAEATRSAHVGAGPGTVVTSVEARGKHLLVTFDDGWVLESHMRMTGSWHLYRVGEAWQRPPHQVRAVVQVEGDPGWVAVCFSAPVVEWVRAPRTDHLGPDLCLPDADLAEAVRRMARLDPTTPLADVLLDQRVCCGVGNVYKSEVAFALRLHPLTPIGAIGSDVRAAIAATAARLLQHNLTTPARTTVAGPPGSLAVYGRGGEPCRRCATPIERATTGSRARSTYWCPRCQPAP